MQQGSSGEKSNTGTKFNPSSGGGTGSAPDFSSSDDVTPSSPKLSSTDPEGGGTASHPASSTVEKTRFSAPDSPGSDDKTSTRFLMSSPTKPGGGGTASFLFGRIIDRLDKVFVFGAGPQQNNSDDATGKTDLFRVDGGAMSLGGSSDSAFSPLESKKEAAASATARDEAAASATLPFQPVDDRDTQSGSCYSAPEFLAAGMERLLVKPSSTPSSAPPAQPQEQSQEHRKRPCTTGTMFKKPSSSRAAADDSTASTKHFSSP